MITGLHRAGVAQGAHQPPRQGADVGAPVAADLGLVADAAQADAGELAAEGPRDGRAERGLAGAGRPDEREDDAARPSSIPRSRRSLRTARYSRMRSLTSSRPAWSASSTSRAAATSRCSSERTVPRQRDHPLEVGADHPGLGALGLALEAGELALGLLARRLGHAAARRCASPSRRRRRPRVLAELLADGGELAAQQHLALGLVEALGDVLADAPAQAGVGQPLALGGDGQPQALDDVDRAAAARAWPRAGSRARSRPCRPGRPGG